MGFQQDITGNRYGRLIVLQCVGNDKFHNSLWLCRCNCGKDKITTKNRLKTGRTKSCGCLYIENCRNKETKSKQAPDFVGRKFGYFYVIRQAKNNARDDSRWMCRCRCGKLKVALGSQLRSGRTKSCGCRKLEFLKKRAELEGKKFGRLSVIKYAGKYRDREALWECLCDCGNIIKVHTATLTSGHTKSCGCLHSEITSRIHSGKNNNNWKGGVTPERVKERHSKENIFWRKSVFERDNYTCQKCRVKGVYLHAHHIVAFFKNKKKRYDIKNGITLCKKCHDEFHKQHGYKEFGKDNLTLYLKAA